MSGGKKFVYNTGNYDKYTSKNYLKRTMVNRFNKKLLEILNNEKQRVQKNEELISVIDVGCGEGFVTDLIYKNIVGIDIMGVEYTSEAIHIAQKRNDKIKYIQGDIYNLYIKNKDIVICTEVLEHLEKPNVAICELINAAKENGSIIVTVPNEPWFCLGNLMALKNVKRFGNPIDHINHWTNGTFRKMILSECSDCSKIEFHKSFPWIIAVIRKGIL